MSTVTFDTLDFTRRLREAGFDEKQAESVVRIVADAQGNIVTREHFDSRMELTDIRFREMEYRLTIKLGAFMAASIAIVATLVKLI